MENKVQKEGLTTNDEPPDDEGSDVEFTNVEYLIEDPLAEFSPDDFTLCNICYDTFRKADLQQHMESNHFEHQCPNCDKKYFLEAHLRRHLRCAHLENLQLPCPFCDVVLCKKYNYQQHILTHSTKPLFSCSHCQRRFRHINSLKQHEKIHEKRNRRECPICHELVTRLSSHIFTHTSERSYICSECRKAFVTADLRKQHIKSTHGNQEFDCSACGGKFKTRSGLYKHRRTTHSNVTHCCPICGRNYNRRDNMKTHMKNAHGDQDGSRKHKKGDQSRSISEEVDEFV